MPNFDLLLRNCNLINENSISQVDIAIKDKRIEKISDPVSFAFDIVKESFSYHQKILDAETKARKVLTTDQAKQLSSYDILDFEKPYLDILYLETKDLLNERLGKSVVRLASIWQYCWEQAGKPDLS